MTPYSELGKEELLALKKELGLQYEDAKGKGLKLDMSRGKPAPAQLDMTMPMMDIWLSGRNLRCTPSAGRAAGGGCGACYCIWYGKLKCHV